MVNIKMLIDVVRLKLNEPKQDLSILEVDNSSPNAKEKQSKWYKRKFNFAMWFAILETTSIVI